jgi:putative membrane protein
VAGVKFVDATSRQAFRAAIERIEQASAAEVLVAVRRRSASYPHAHVLVGAGTAIAAHAFMLYSAHPFSISALLLDPVIAGVAGGLLSTLSLGVERVLTMPSTRRRAVAQAARATFLERGLHRTRRATGILVYLSQVERQVEIVADDGVLAAIDEPAWSRAVAAVQAAVPGGGVAVARALGDLAPLLGAALPRAHDDVNELPDDLDAGEGTS